MTTTTSARQRSLHLASELRELRDRLQELHRRTGIAGAVENLILPSGIPDLEAPLGSEARRGARGAENDYENGRFVHGLRRLYFGAANLELRRELIQVSRRLEEKHLAETWAWVDEAREHLARTKRPPHWAVAAAVAGLAAVWFGHRLVGVPGAISAAVVAVLFGRSLEAKAKARQGATIAAAEEALRSAQEMARKVADQGSVFSRAEAASGEEAAQQVV